MFKKVHRIIRFGQKAWLKSYTDINIKLRKKTKNDFQKKYFNVHEQRNFLKNHEQYEKNPQRYEACNNWRE